MEARNIYDKAEDLQGINLSKLTESELDHLYNKCIGECENIVANEIDARSIDFDEDNNIIN